MLAPLTVRRSLLEPNDDVDSYSNDNAHAHTAVTLTISQEAHKTNTDS